MKRHACEDGIQEEEVWTERNDMQGEGLLMAVLLMVDGERKNGHVLTLKMYGGAYDAGDGGEDEDGEG